MKIIRYVVLSLLSLPGTFYLTKWWQSSWLSERTWTWLNQLFGQDFGLASDIELLLTIACAFSLSFATTSFLFWVLQMLYSKQGEEGAGRMKEVIHASLTGFWVLLATYFLHWLGGTFGFLPDWRENAFGAWAYLGVSFIVVLAVTLLGFFLWRRTSKRANKSFQRTR